MSKKQFIKKTEYNHQRLKKSQNRKTGFFICVEHLQNTLQCNDDRRHF